MNLLYVTLKWTFRDRVFHALLGAGLLLFCLVPFFSTLSMRQVQELSVTLSLSAISLVLLVLATVLGATTVWRDVERRYTAAVLGLPIPRSSYILGRFAGVSLIIVSCAILLGAVSLAVIAMTTAQYPSARPVLWQNVVAAVGADALKYTLLAAVAILFSSLSTSFFLPFFGTISIYLAGSASQEVYEYISGDFGRSLSVPAKALIKGAYYLLPNFSAFDLKVQAVYGLPLAYGGLLYTFLYFLVYTFMVISLSVMIFARRELP